jgi:hypothetical protein
MGRSHRSVRRVSSNLKSAIISFLLFDHAKVTNFITNKSLSIRIFAIIGVRQIKCISLDVFPCFISEKDA